MREEFLQKRSNIALCLYPLLGMCFLSFCLSLSAPPYSSLSFFLSPSTPPRRSPYVPSAIPLEENRFASVSKYLSERKTPYDVFGLTKEMSDRETQSLSVSGYHLGQPIVVNPPPLADAYLPNSKFQQVVSLFSLNSQIHKRIFLFVYFLCPPVSIGISESPFLSIPPLHHRPHPTLPPSRGSSSSSSACRRASQAPSHPSSSSDWDWQHQGEGEGRQGEGQVERSSGPIAIPRKGEVEEGSEWPPNFASPT